MNTFAHTRPVRDKAGAVTGDRPSPAVRVTVAALGHQFGSDKRARLVVSLKAGDVIEFRPSGTQRPISMLAVDLYAHALRTQAAKAHLEKARNTKAAKQAARAARRIRATDKRLARQARAERQNQ